MVKQLKGDINAKYQFIQNLESVGADKLKALREFADKEYSTHIEKLAKEDLEDFKINLTKEQLISIIG